MVRTASVCVIYWEFGSQEARRKERAYKVYKGIHETPIEHIDSQLEALKRQTTYDGETARGYLSLRTTDTPPNEAIFCSALDVAMW